MSTPTKPITRRSQTLLTLKLVNRQRDFSCLRAMILLIISESTDAEGQPCGIDVQEISYQIGRPQNNLVATMRDAGLITGENFKVTLTEAGEAEVRRIIEGRLPGEPSRFGPEVDMKRVKAFVGHISKEER